MDDDLLDKFVANMRAAGQPDEMIAENLIAAGHSELMILNALGVEHMSQLLEDEDDDEDEAPAAPAQHTPSAYVVVDADGNPVINQDNQPQAVGAQPAAPAQPKPATAHPAATRPPRPARHYPRPPARHVSTMKSQPKPTQFVRPHTGLAAPKDGGFIHPTTTGSHANDKVESKREITPPPKKKPLVMPTETAEQKPRPELAKQAAKPAINYGHHSFDDFLGRIEAHKELTASHDAVLEPHFDHSDKPTAPDIKPVSGISPHPVESKPAKKTPAKPQGPANIDALLHEQREEAAAGPGGPDMDDLLDAKDLEELRDHPETQSPMPKPVDLKNIPQTPQIARVGGVASDFRNSIALKVVVIMIAVLALVGLTASVISRISG